MCSPDPVKPQKLNSVESMAPLPDYSGFLDILDISYIKVPLHLGAFQGVPYEHFKR